jgi:hypothetical protein
LLFFLKKKCKRAYTDRYICWRSAASVSLPELTKAAAPLPELKRTTTTRPAASVSLPELT